MKSGNTDDSFWKYLPTDEDQFELNQPQLSQKEEIQSSQIQLSQQVNSLKNKNRTKMKKIATIVLSDDEQEERAPINKIYRKSDYDHNKFRQSPINHDAEVRGYIENKLGMKFKQYKTQNKQQTQKWQRPVIITQQIKNKKHIHQFAPYIMLPGDVWPPNYFKRSYDPLRRQIAEKRRNI